jgi:hypothetical protein
MEWANLHIRRPSHRRLCPKNSISEAAALLRYSHTDFGLRCMGGNGPKTQFVGYSAELGFGERFSRQLFLRRPVSCFLVFTKKIPVLPAYSSSGIP